MQLSDNTKGKITQIWLGFLLPMIVTFSFLVFYFMMIVLSHKAQEYNNSKNPQESNLKHYYE